MSRPGVGPLLAIDAGSPRVSVAVGEADRVLAEAGDDRERSSATLLALIDSVLAEAGLRARDLAGVVALRGPGSFTGLRVGLATALGLHQALGMPATGIATLEVLADLGPGDDSTVTAVVDALRGDWFAQPFRSAEDPLALEEARLVSTGELLRRRPDLVVGFGTEALAAASGGLRVVEPRTLAGPAVRRAARPTVDWNPATLVEPLYLRPPSARPGGRPA